MLESVDLATSGLLRIEVHEPARRLLMAAALKEKQVLAGKRVGLVITGGNVDFEVFARVLLA